MKTKLFSLVLLLNFINYKLQAQDCERAMIRMDSLFRKELISETLKEGENVCLYCKEHENYVDFINVLAYLHETQKNFVRAEALFKQIVALKKIKFGEVDSNYAGALYKLAENYSNQNKFEMAEPLFIQALAINKDVFGEKHPYYVSSLNNLAIFFLNQGNYLKSESLYKQALSIRKNAFGENHPDYIASLTNLGELYLTQGKYTTAQLLFEQVLDKRKNSVGENHPDYATTLNLLANTYSEQGEYKKAEPLLLKCLTIRKKEIGVNHPDYGVSLNNLASLYKVLGCYSKAEPLYIEALQISKDANGEDHMNSTNPLLNLAGLYKDNGQYNKSEPLILQALAIIKTSLGETDPNYAFALNTLGGLYQAKGEYAKAEPIYQKALAIRKEVYGEKHPRYANSLNNLAELYINQGDINKAEPMYKQSIEIYKNALGESHIDNAAPINNLASLYESQGNYTQAQPLFEKALAIVRTALGETHPLYAKALNNLANLYKFQHKFIESEKLYKQALLIRKVALGETHPDYATTLYNLGYLHATKGDYKQAELLLKQSILIFRQSFGERHPDYETAVNILGLLYQTQGKYVEANQYYLNFYNIKKNNLQYMLSYLSGKQAKEYIYKEAFKLEALYSQIINNPISALKDSMLNYTYFIKGALLQNTNRLSNAATLSVDAKVQENWTEYKDKKRYIAQLYQLSKDKQNELASTQDEADKLEKWLMQNVPEFKESVNNNNIKWKQVQAKLDDGEAAIEFVNFKYQNKHWTDTTIYAAFIIKKGIEQPIFINCFQEKELVALLNNKSDAEEINKLYNGSKTSTKKSLYDLVWKPLDTALQGITTIYLSPSGLLHKVAFAAIGTPSNKRLSDIYELHFLNNTRALAENKKAITKPASIALLGGIDYDEQATNNATTKDAIVLTDKNINTLRNATFNNWSYLPGTNKEVVAINNLLQNQNITTIYNGTNASEELLKEMGTSKLAVPAVLHFATHGYAMPEPKQVYKDRSNFIRDKKEPLFYNSEDALTRSGLILAGANKMWTTGKPFPNKEDGILTAREIMELNLSVCQLTVLSACETGLGTLEGSEGIYGLQRALKIAGVQNIIVSLWAVPDAETSEFMQLFYTNWLVKNMEMQKAFSATQQSMSAKYDVQKWGAFVLMQ